MGNRQNHQLKLQQGECMLNKMLLDSFLRKKIETLFLNELNKQLTIYD